MRKERFISKLHILMFLYFFSFISAFAQRATVKGIVVDETNTPLIGVHVVQKGTSNRTISDLNGKFSINVPQNSTLVFNYIGFAEQEVVWDGKSTLNIVLREDTELLSEVVVVGYATMKKRDLVGAVDAIDSEILDNRANSNLLRSLQGSVSGLNISIGDGKPSHGGSFNVRGAGSIGAGGSSLVLIDGVEGSLESVNPQDVESVSVLKDASSTAVYGARGAFGVILVTTKKARKGQPVVNYSGSYSINRRTIIPDGITDSNDWFDWWKTGYNNYYNGSKLYW